MAAICNLCKKLWEKYVTLSASVMNIRWEPMGMIHQNQCKDYVVLFIVLDKKNLINWKFLTSDLKSRVKFKSFICYETHLCCDELVIKCSIIFLNSFLSKSVMLQRTGVVFIVVREFVILCEYFFFYLSKNF